LLKDKAEDRKLSYKKGMYFSFISSIIFVNKFRSDESVDKDEKKTFTYNKTVSASEVLRPVDRS